MQEQALAAVELVVVVADQGGLVPAPQQLGAAGHERWRTVEAQHSGHAIAAARELDEGGPDRQELGHIPAQGRVAGEVGGPGGVALGEIPALVGRGHAGAVLGPRRARAKLLEGGES